MERRHALLPVCSGCLGVWCVALQLIAVATPHWASFWTNDYYGTGINRPEQAFEAGYYGLWTLCLTTQQWEELEEVQCNLRETYYKPGKLRYVAGAFAIGNLLLLLVFLSPVPAQLLFLVKDKGVVPVSFRCLTTIKLITSSVGCASAIAAVAIVNIDNQNETFQEQKQWSFGMQVVVIVLSVFLLICSSAEHMVGRQYPVGPLSKVRKTRTLAAISNPGFDDKTPETRPINIPTSLYETEVAPIKRTNLKATSSEKAPSYRSEPLSVKTLEQLTVDKSVKKKPKEPDKRQKQQQSEETTSMMQYSNPEFRNSFESGLDDLEEFQYKNNSKDKKPKTKTFYHFGDSSDSNHVTAPSPVYSIGNLSARSTDV